jgi:hypothetical protein
VRGVRGGESVRDDFLKNQRKNVFLWGQVKRRVYMSNNAIQVHSEINLTVPEVLKGISKLETSELEDFFQHVGMLVARRKSPSLPVRESVLLQIINRGYPLELQARYTTLSAKLLTEQITDVEHEELLTLVVQLEQKNAERLQALLELAQIRGLSLEALMEDLNLTPPGHGG